MSPACPIPAIRSRSSEEESLKMRSSNNCRALRGVFDLPLAWKAQHIQHRIRIERAMQLEPFPVSAFVQSRCCGAMLGGDPAVQIRVADIFRQSLSTHTRSEIVILWIYGPEVQGAWIEDRMITKKRLARDHGWHRQITNVLIATFGAATWYFFSSSRVVNIAIRA